MLDVDESVGDPAEYNLIDELNLRTMRSDAVVDFYSDFSGLLLHERAALRLVGGAARGKPILDLGVGGGRTVKPLLKVSEDYLGIDYSPEMVEACKQRFPKQRFVLGDARDLSMVADESVFLVSFGWNGICMVNHQDRLRILSQIYRKLTPGGIFILTTHNRNCPDEFQGFRFPEFTRSQRRRDLIASAWKYCRATAASLSNWSRYRHRVVRLPEYSIINDRSHDYGVMLYHIDLVNQRKQIEALGYEGNAIAFGTDGKVAEDSYDGRDFAMVARKSQSTRWPRDFHDAR